MSTIKNIIAQVPEQHRSIFARSMANRIQSAMAVAQHEAALNQARARMVMADQGLKDIISIICNQQVAIDGLKYDMETGDIYKEVSKSGE